MKKSTYIVIKDNSRRHPEKRVFKSAELAHIHFRRLVEDGFYPVCFIKSPGLFGRTRRANWDEEYLKKLEEKRREFFNRSVMSH